MAAEGRREAALVHYRRAILGSWAEKREASRCRARKELIDFLVKAGEGTQARAEVLSLAADVPNDPELQVQVGRMLIEHGLLREATALFRNLLRTGPPNAAEYDGLGEAMFLLGRYSEARDAFRKALSIDRMDSVAARRAELSDQILKTDPTQHGIPSRERF